MPVFSQPKSAFANLDDLPVLSRTVGTDIDAFTSAVKVVSFCRAQQRPAIRGDRRPHEAPPGQRWNKD